MHKPEKFKIQSVALGFLDVFGCLSLKDTAGPTRGCFKALEKFYNMGMIIAMVGAQAAEAPPGSPTVSSLTLCIRDEVQSFGKFVILYQ